MPPVYTIYGLRIDAGAVLPGLLPDCATRQEEVCIRLGTWPADAVAHTHDGTPFYVDRERTVAGEPALAVDRAPSGSYYRLRYADGFEFAVDDTGTQVWGRWPESQTDADALAYLLNPVLGFVLRLRGVTALHASAIVVDDGAVVIAGPSGAGKSTLAAALAARGCPVLADDIVALGDHEGGLVAYPAYAHLRLWPESGALLFGSSDALPPLTPTWEKRRLDLDQPGYRMQTEPTPLRAVYVLAPRTDEHDAPRIEITDQSSALLSLVTNVYSAAIPLTAARGHDLTVLGQLVRDIPVRRILPHADPSRLGELCDTLVADVRRLRSTAVRE